jgi:tubulin-specific chaperone A
MINTNPLNFMLEFSRGLNGMNATEVAKTLDFLGVNADGANKVVATMGDNYERFVELIDLSNTSFAEGTSMLNEFNVKNETLQATLEKIGKRVAELFSSVGCTNWLAGLVSWFAKLIGATADADGKMEGFRNRLIFLIKVLAIVITSYVSYNAALRLTALWTQTLSSLTTILNAIQNRGAVATGLLRSAQLLLASAYYAVTGNTSRATAAMRLFNATSASNPIGLVVAAVLGLVVALKLFSKTN